MTSATKDETFMRAAIAASREAMAAGNLPYGATLASAAGAQLMVAQNNRITSGDFSGHAEMVLVRQAAATLGPAALVGATVYASGEPCAMCAGAMFWAGIRRVVFAVAQNAIPVLPGAPLLPVGCRTVYADASPPMTVDGPYLQDEALAVLEAFAHKQ